MTLLQELRSLLQKDKRLVSDDELLKNRIVELALKLDKDLIKTPPEQQKSQRALLQRSR